MPTDIEPVTAPSFFRISISYVENDHVETHIQFYQYMTQKYKNVTTICYKHDAEMLEYHPDEARHVYLNGILGFYRIMKPYDRELEIYFVPDNVDIFKVIDEMDWQLEVLCISLCQGGTLFQYLAQSNQSKTIQKLKLKDTEIGTPRSIHSMAALTKLDVKFDNTDDSPTINFTDYLNGCPATLKRFSINCPNFGMNPSLTFVNHMEVFVIRCNEITRDLGAIISTCFHHLIRLILSGTLYENVDILLHCYSLTLASFLIRKTDTYGFSFNSRGNVDAHHYICSRLQKTRVSFETLKL
jgi:hypothetical protein